MTDILFARQVKQAKILSVSTLRTRDEQFIITTKDRYVFLLRTDKREPLLVDGKLKQSMLTVNGKHYRCACGCNVFHHPDKTNLKIYACNACEQELEAE